MADLLNLLISTIFVNNILLAYFLGMCSYLACSKNMKTAAGLGLAVIFVLTITVPMNWLLNHFLLTPGALAWAGFPDVDLSFLGFITFISTIAAMTQIVEMTLERFVPALYSALGVFLPLIAVNCAILGASLFMVERHYDLTQATVFGVGSGLGWSLAIITFSAVLQKLKYANPPEGLKGFPLNIIATGLIAMAFMAFAGIKF